MTDFRPQRDFNAPPPSCRPAVVAAICVHWPQWTRERVSQYLEELGIEPDSYRSLGDKFDTPEKIAAWVVDTFRGPNRLPPSEETP